MSWLTVYGPTAELHAAYRRLSATAKHLQKTERHGRTRDQIRADLAIAWLTGAGTATAVKTKVFVTIPAQLLAGVPVPPEQAEIVGGRADRPAHGAADVPRRGILPPGHHGSDQGRHRRHGSAHLPSDQGAAGLAHPPIRHLLPGRLQQARDRRRLRPRPALGRRWHDRPASVAPALPTRSSDATSHPGEIPHETRGTHGRSRHADRIPQFGTRTRTVLIGSPRLRIATTCPPRTSVEP